MAPLNSARLTWCSTPGDEPRSRFGSNTNVGSIKMCQTGPRLMTPCLGSFGLRFGWLEFGLVSLTLSSQGGNDGIFFPVSISADLGQTA